METAMLRRLSFSSLYGHPESIRLRIQGHGMDSISAGMTWRLFFLGGFDFLYFLPFFQW